jgi:hypothetical protein
MILDKMNTIIVVPTDPVYQKLLELVRMILIQRVISNCNNAGFSTLCLFAMLLDEMNAIIAIPKDPVYQFERFWFVAQFQTITMQD